MDVEQVMSATQAAVERARSDQGPSLLECKAYRYQGHFTAERALKLTYRLQDEIEHWRGRDPILSWAAKLEERNILSAQECAFIDEEVAGLIDEAVTYARASEWPDGEEAFADMYVTAYPGCRKGVRVERQLTYLQALREALMQEMRADPNVIVVGEDVRHALRGITKGILEEFGPDRIWDAPISEAAFVGMGTGAAIAGLRPVIEFQIPTLLYVAMDQLANQHRNFDT